MSEQLNNEELVVWYTVGDFREIVSRVLFREPKEEELRRVIEIYQKCDLTEIEEVITEIIQNHQEGEFYYNSKNPEFLKIKGVE